MYLASTVPDAVLEAAAKVVGTRDGRRWDRYRGCAILRQNPEATTPGVRNLELDPMMRWCSAPVGERRDTIAGPASKFPKTELPHGLGVSLPYKDKIPRHEICR